MQITNNFVGTLFELQDEAAGGDASEDVPRKSEAEHDAFWIVADFVEGDGAVEPEAEFGETSGSEGEEERATAGSGLVFCGAEEVAATEAIEGGIDGAGGVGIMAEGRGGKTFAEGVAGGGLLVKESEEEIFEVGEVAHVNWVIVRYVLLIVRCVWFVKCRASQGRRQKRLPFGGAQRERREPGSRSPGKQAA